MRLFRSGLRKLVRRPATWVTFLLMAGLLAFVYLSIGATSSQLDSEGQSAAALLLTFPEAYLLIVSFTVSLGILAVVYGAAIAGSEWTWGTLKSAVARGEGRIFYILTTYLSIVVFVGIGLLLTFLVGVVCAILGALMAGIPTEGLDDGATLGRLPELLSRAYLALAMNAAIGFAVATILRSQLAGIGVGIGLSVAEGFAGIFAPEIVQYLPFSAAGALLGVADIGNAPIGPQLDPNMAILVVGGWLVGSLAVASVFTERAEISG